MPALRMGRRVRIAAALALVGLIVELVALLWSHPTAFLVFALAGMPLVGMGILVFLYSLVSIAE